MQGFFRCDRIIDEQGNSPCLPEIVGMLLGGHSKAAGQQQEPAGREDTMEMAEAAADKRTGWKNEAGLCGVKRR